MTYRQTFFVLLIVSITMSSIAGAQQPSLDDPVPPSEGAYHTGEYRNMLHEWGLSETEIQERIDATWQQLFYGNENSERIYYPVGDDMAYMLDVASNDVRSEGMSYGMMIAVQLDKKEEFDRLWTWTKTFMYQESGAYTGYFAWHCRTDGTKIDQNPASDGEIWFATALFFAAGRWGNGEGIYDYEAEANSILYTMLHQEENPRSASTNMFNAENKQVVFVPSAGAESRFTDPSYHMPQFYEIWAERAATDNEFWAEAAVASREFFPLAAHPETGLMPNYAQFDGSPQPRGDYGKYFYADAWRVPMNVAFDYAWFAADPWQIEQSDRIQAFFYEQGLNRYSDKWLIDGSESFTNNHSQGLVATNAVASLAATNSIAWEFIEEFWNTPLPSGHWRYYDGLLYFMSLLHLSGQFRIY